MNVYKCKEPRCNDCIVIIGKEECSPLCVCDVSCPGVDLLSPEWEIISIDILRGYIDEKRC